MKKRELEDWEMAECIALKKAIDAFNAGKLRKERISQGDIADALGINQGSVSSYLNGVNALNAKAAGIIAGMIRVPVESFSPRLAKEIAAMAQAVQQPTEKPPAGANRGAVSAGQMAELMGLATPRSRAVLQRINQAADEGRLSEADIDLLDQIAARFETNSRPQVRGEGSHKRLRERLQNDDSHPKQ